MKFGQEFQQTLESEDFPREWLDAAVQYKSLKKCIKKVNKELEDIGLEPKTLGHFADFLQEAQPLSPQSSANSGKSDKGKERAASNSARADSPRQEEAVSSLPANDFVPQLRVLIDKVTGQPLDATLAPETRESLRRLASSERVATLRRKAVGWDNLQTFRKTSEAPGQISRDQTPDGTLRTSKDCAWVEVPLSSAQHFFDLLEPKLDELDALSKQEESKLEDQILELGDRVQDVTEPVREGFEAKRKVSYRDLYFWREMFRLYMEKPIFFSTTERNRGALKFADAKSRLEEFDEKLRSTGLLAKMKTPLAKETARKFLDLNVDILRIIHFQEMNGRAIRKILKKFDKRTHIEGQQFLKALRLRHPSLETTAKGAPGTFANSIARDLNAEIASKVLAVVPQLEDWNCPVCYSMAWKPVNLGCCRSVFCIRCIIQLQADRVRRCPVCNRETVMPADGRNIDFETMDFLEKYFPLEVKHRQKENERAQLVRDYGEEFVKPGCSQM